MTIRDDRNRAARQAALNVAAGYRCPDCNASTSMGEQAPGVFVLEMAHDPTCPIYRALDAPRQDRS